MMRKIRLIDHTAFQLHRNDFFRDGILENIIRLALQFIFRRIKQFPEILFMLFTLFLVCINESLAPYIISGCQCLNIRFCMFHHQQQDQQTHHNDDHPVCHPKTADDIFKQLRHFSPTNIPLLPLPRIKSQSASTAFF